MALAADSALERPSSRYWSTLWLSDFAETGRWLHRDGDASGRALVQELDVIRAGATLLRPPRVDVSLIP